MTVVKSKNAESLHIIKSIYENGKRTSEVVEKLGTYDHLLKSLPGQDPIEWGKSYAEELTKKKKRVITQSFQDFIMYTYVKTQNQNI